MYRLTNSFPYLSFYFSVRDDSARLWTSRTRLLTQQPSRSWPFLIMTSSNAASLLRRISRVAMATVAAAVPLNAASGEKPTQPPISSRHVPIINVDGYRFRDLDHDG